MHAVAQQFHVAVSTVWYWVEHARTKGLQRTSFSNDKPGRAWNRTAASMERRILALRGELRENSDLGEYGARAIRVALEEAGEPAPSPATINRILARNGALDQVRRVRRPAPPRGWYLPDVAAGRSELDSFDWIEELKIAEGPLIQVLTGTSLWAGEVNAWPELRLATDPVLSRLCERWKELGLPDCAQFDNDTVFQGAHQFPDTIGRVSRLCLALGVVPVFAPPREPGFQNGVESFNGLWQAKVWQRHHFRDFTELLAINARYIAAHRARSATRREQAPVRRPFPKGFQFNPHIALRGKIIFVRRTDDAGRAHLMGRRFDVTPLWSRRLVRCEVDLDAGHIRFHGLRRREPADQPLLQVIHYHRPNKRFRG